MARALHGPNVPQALGIMIPPGLASHSSNQERFPSSLEMQAQLLDVGTERREGIRGRGGGAGSRDPQRNALRQHCLGAGRGWTPGPLGGVATATHPPSLAPHPPSRPAHRK